MFKLFYLNCFLLEDMYIIKFQKRGRNSYHLGLHFDLTILISSLAPVTFNLE